MTDYVKIGIDNIKKPQNETELQQLVNFIAERIDEKAKYKVSVNGKLKRFNAIAHTYGYVLHGTRKIEVSKKYFLSCEKELLIRTIIHEIAHFKQSKYQKLRRQNLKYGKMFRDTSLGKGFINRKLLRKHAHTNSFYKLCQKLEIRFYGSFMEKVELSQTENLTVKGGV